MSYFSKLSQAQFKEQMINSRKKKEAENERAIKHPFFRAKSYSALHRAYDRTNYGDLNKKTED